MTRPIPESLFDPGRWPVRVDGLASLIPEPRVMSAAELRRLDSAAVEELGLPSPLLMENAALHASSLVAPMCAPDTGVLVVAGTGNNGGDGLALARLLLAQGVHARVRLVGDPARLSPDAALNHAALPPEVVIHDGASSGDRADDLGLTGSAIDETRPSVIVDALFGTGLSRAIGGHAATAVDAINAASAAPGAPWVVSLDLPSGLDADRGVPLGPCVRAGLTVTFAAIKRGFTSVDAQPLLGQLALVPIGVPASFAARFGSPLGLDPVGNWRADRRDAGRGVSRAEGAGRDARR